MTYELGWFSTARGPGSRALLQAVQEAIQSGEIKAQIAFVFCSREPGESEATDIFLRMVKDYGIPLVTCSYRQFKQERGIKEIAEPASLPGWRLEYDREVMARLKDFKPDLCVLAGYMLVVGRELCQKYHIINLHPAAPGGPKGTWQEVIWQLITQDARETGVMMHLVIPELDEGPPVTYCTFSIRGEPFDRYWEEIRGRSVEEIKKKEGENHALFRLIRQHGAARELPLIIATLKAFSEGKIRITPDKKLVDARGKPVKGYHLTREVDEAVRGKVEKS